MEKLEKKGSSLRDVSFAKIMYDAFLAFRNTVGT